MYVFITTPIATLPPLIVHWIYQSRMSTSLPLLLFSPQNPSYPFVPAVVNFSKPPNKSDFQSIPPLGQIVSTALNALSCPYSSPG